MILSMQDEETGAEPRVLSASICDPYLLLIRDDSSAFVAHMNSEVELEEIDKTESALTTTKWISGCLYADSTGILSLAPPAKGQKNILMFLLSSTGALQVCCPSDILFLDSVNTFQVYALPDLSKPIYTAEGLCHIPPILTPAWAARRGTFKETITEILVADLGDAIAKSPHLIVSPSSLQDGSQTDPGSYDMPMTT